VLKVLTASGTAGELTWISSRFPKKSERTAAPAALIVL
jgi:hypothetical protein